MMITQPSIIRPTRFVCAQLVRTDSAELEVFGELWRVHFDFWILTFRLTESDLRPNKLSLV